jgi:hypothetical protein
VELGVVHLVDRGGEAALGVAGVALAERALGDEEDASGEGEAEREGQPGDAGAGDEDIDGDVAVGSGVDDDISPSEPIRGTPGSKWELVYHRHEVTQTRMAILFGAVQATPVPVCCRRNHADRKFLSPRRGSHGR